MLDEYCSQTSLVNFSSAVVAFARRSYSLFCKSLFHKHQTSLLILVFVLRVIIVYSGVFQTAAVPEQNTYCGFLSDIDVK